MKLQEAVTPGVSCMSRTMMACARQSVRPAHLAPTAASRFNGIPAEDFVPKIARPMTAILAGHRLAGDHHVVDGGYLPVHTASTGCFARQPQGTQSASGPLPDAP